jgi:hypothetical protein
VLQSIYDNLFKNRSAQVVRDNIQEIIQDKPFGSNSSSSNEEDDDKHFFDIIAGVSIGAINAVFLIDYVLKNNGKWNDAPSRQRILGKF